MARYVPLRMTCLFIIGAVLVAADDQNQQLASANAAFAIDLFKKIVEENVGKNIFLSPVSIAAAFGMVNLGARGTTQSQMKSVLHLDKLSSDSAVNEAYKQLLHAFKQQTNNYTIQMANRLFGSDKFQFRQQFLNESERYFQASLQKIDFTDEPDKSRLIINDWVAEQTNQLIKDLLPKGSIMPNTILAIVNAIYFKAYWSFPFHKNLTRSLPFSISKTEKVNLDTMAWSSENPLNYHKAEDLDCEVIELPYHGERASMFIFLPKEVDGLQKLETQLTGDRLLQTIAKVTYASVKVYLPRFQIDQGISLKKFLQLLGMTELFDGNKSDLSGIGGPQRLVVSDAIHKAYVKVDELGTEAAAATAVLISLTSLPVNVVEFRVDRPFMFVIFEKNTKSVLFIGRFVRPPTAGETIGKFGEFAAQQSKASLIDCDLFSLWSSAIVLASFRLFSP